jgi:hypothetical protein
MQPLTADPPLRAAVVRLAWLTAPLAVSLALAWSRLPTDDPPAYFAFADTRSWAGVPHASNVLSNLPFLAVAGWVWRRLGTAHPGDRGWRRAAQWLCGGLGCTALGSAWFHAAPGPASLFWDRLPMAMTFSGLALLLVADRISDRLAWALRWALPLGAVATVLVWRFGGTLRPYLALQFGLMALTLLIALATRGGRLGGATLGAMLGLYSAAKLLEVADSAVWTATSGLVAGHGLKHLLAAAALAVLALRRPGAPSAAPLQRAAVGAGADAG